MRPVTWSRAWRESSRDFWSREQPSAHFTTSAGALVAERMVAILREVDACLGHPDMLEVVDFGCGDGTLLARMRDECADLGPRVRWIGVDMRPFDVDGVESVVAEAPCDPPVRRVRGLVMAHEWLDEIPCDVIERDEDGVDRLVLVDRRGVEVLGPALSDGGACDEYGVDAAAARSWLARWWPLDEPGDRAEVGISRDLAWQWMTGLLAEGTALATDYGHIHAERTSRERHGTLAAYASGRLARPVPDGAVNLTAHVALDACICAVAGTTLTMQRDEIDRVRLGEVPSAADVERHFSALRLRDRDRLGGVAWLRWDARRDGLTPASTLPMW